MLDLFGVAPLDSAADPERAAEFWVELQALKSRVKEADKFLTECVLEWCKENKKGLRIEETLIYAGHKKQDARVREVVPALEAIIEFVDGSPEGVAQFLSSSALLSGEFKKQLGQETWDEHFEQKTVPTLKEGKRPPKGLVVINTHFARLPE